ncbi:MAG: nitrate reductase molybdenum cofactor assembly chaperone [Gammaproteobacteria bacterium]|nr:nitrate reductase molybdenum cofactor assembly chaperone [Gammaproteobacteria bacterium]
MNTPESNNLKWPLKAVAMLLHYPDADLQTHIDQVAEVLLVRPELSTEERASLEQFSDSLRHRDLYDLEADYVETFDRSKKVSLYLFEHVHGESRDRGPAMVELSNAYKEKGFIIDCRELPDYLPMFLEFCASLPEAEARTWLEDTGHILQRIHVRLEDRENAYALPFRVLLRLLDLDPRPAELVQEASEEERDDTPAALDRVWMEAPVTFGPDQPMTSCGASKQWVEKPVKWKSLQPAGGQQRHQ